MNIRKAVVFPEPTFCIAAWREVMARYYRQDGFEGHDDTPISITIAVEDDGTPEGKPVTEPFGPTRALAYGERLAAELL